MHHEEDSGLECFGMPSERVEQRRHKNECIAIARLLAVGSFGLSTLG
jgi:hypothetical protein